MACAAFEDRLLDYHEMAAAERAALDVHLAECAACREYLEVLAALDAGLTDLYAGARVSAEFRNAMAGLTPQKLSWIPELLDFLGWTAVIAFLFGALLYFIPLRVLLTPYVMAACAIAASAAAWICVRPLVESED